MTNRFILWTLFLVQLGCAAVFGLSQFWQMLSSTKGVSMSWYGTWEIFLLLNLWLSWRAHKAQASLVTGQTLMIYSFYAVMIALDLSVTLLRRSWEWSVQDSLTALLVAIGVTGTLLIGRLRGHSISNPLVKGCLAIFFKAVPQIVMACYIPSTGGSGLALAAIVAGHVTILIRLGQLALAIREAGWDKNRLGSFISEVPNELSWIAVTVVWVLWVRGVL